LVMPLAFSAAAVREARVASDACLGYCRDLADGPASVGSPPPTSTIELADCPCVTRVDRRASGPSEASAAVQVTSLVVDAGVMPMSALEAKIRWPVAASMTTAPTRSPSALSPRASVSCWVKVRLAARGPSPALTWSWASTGPAVITGTGGDPSGDGVGSVGDDPLVNAPRLNSLVIA
jgi:hypothetical protein